MGTRRHANVVNADEVTPQQSEKGTRYGHVRRRLAAAAGARRLGASLVELAPGKAAWPAHWHTANEEAVYVLEGRGTARLGEEQVPIRAGDWLSFPVGEAHQIRNDSDAPLRYLAVSTMVEPDVTVYPDSGKIAVFAGAAPGGEKAARTLDGTFELASAVDYWKGEEID